MLYAFQKVISGKPNTSGITPFHSHLIGNAMSKLNIMIIKSTPHSIPNFSYAFFVTQDIL